jgi:hypothetical protein
MKKAFWFVTGIAAGLVAAKQLQENPKTKAMVDDVLERVRELGDVVVEGFREREAEIAAEKKSASADSSSATSNI